MKSYKFISCILLLFFAFSVFAQESLSAKIIYLKDGSFLKGKVLQTWEDGSLEIQLFDGSKLFLEATLISQITTDNKKRKYLSSGYSLSPKGWYYGIQLNFLPAKRARQEWSPEGRRYGFGGHLTAGYRFNRFIGLGLGVGFDGYGDYFVPIVLDVRGSLLEKKISPVYAFQIGYGLPAGGEFETYGSEVVTVKREGGLMVYPSVGVRFETRRNVAFVADVGVKLQNLTKSRTYDWGWWTDPNIYIDEIWYRSLAFRFGWEF